MVTFWDFVLIDGHHCNAYNMQYCKHIENVPNKSMEVCSTVRVRIFTDFFAIVKKQQMKQNIFCLFSIFI